MWRSWFVMCMVLVFDVMVVVYDVVVVVCDVMVMVCDVLVLVCVVIGPSHLKPLDHYWDSQTFQTIGP